MQTIWAILKREFRSFFTTSMGYVILVVFLVLAGFLTIKGRFFEMRQADLRVFFDNLPLLYIFFVPAAGMRLWAEERKAGTIEFLFTQPVTVTQAVIGKFLAAWMFLVYFPFTHMVWSTQGWMAGPLNPDAGIKAIDFAGGTVVHMTSGWSALVLCLILGPRLGYGKEAMPPHSLVLCAVGTGMLWVGWYGFNAGSALGADGIAANAFATTTMAAATGGFSWAVVERITRGHMSVLGFCSGIVAGLVVVTPGAGFVSPSSAVAMGLAAGVVPYFAVAYLKRWLGYDDALDTFGVHGVGGTLGALLTGVFADERVNAAVGPLKDGLFMAQLKSVIITIAWSVIATTLIGFTLKAVMGLRPRPEVERAGLDIREHGEEGYIY